MLSHIYYFLTSPLRSPSGHISIAAKPSYPIYSYFNPNLYYNANKIKELQDLKMFYFVSRYLKIKNI